MADDDAPRPAAPAGPLLVDVHQLARFWACDVSIVQRLARKGLIPRAQRGQYPMIEATTRYIVYLRDQAAGRKSGDEKIDAVQENALLKRSQRQAVEMKIAEAEGRLISMPEVEAVWTAVVLTVKQLFLSLPGRARFDIPHLTGHDQKVLTDLCREMLREASIRKMPMPARDPDAATQAL
jgi:phage terminase Nu1 subunit (DNA packaging protein)